ncbi:unnamed protein product [Microthlaspi erraticum]|uniref:Uncharacterized protein n=1 Tax=Microthlaspi erraticum TaxID=1685480 RepID=A0A6D2IXQ1_9BRAS|nr:unnamed protein product [Microthlaspi erraticum]
MGIIQGVNCWKTRSICYGMATSSSLGCLTAVLVQLWSMPPWEDFGILISLAAIFLSYAILVVRSFCLPVPKINNDSRRMGEETWACITASFMIIMFMQSREIQSVQFGIYMFGVLTGGIAVKQLNWPAQDVYIQHVVFTAFWSCLSGVLGYLRPVQPAYSVFAALLFLGFFLNSYLLDQARPVTDFVHSPSRRFRDLDV